MSNFVLTPNAVAKLRHAIAPRSGNTGAVAASGRPIDPDKFPPPFTVRWSASETHPRASEPGCWVIFIPDTGHVVRYGNTYLAPTAYPTQYLFPATTLPSGWYKALNVEPESSSVHLVYIPPGTSQTGYGFTSADRGLLIATMSTDQTTGAKTVKQMIDSALIIADGGGSVNLDDISLDWNSNSQAQIKDWDAGTPASSTTIAQDIHDGNTTAQGAVVERTTGGVLKYKKPGTLAQLLGSSVSFSSRKILTGLSWSTTNHQLVISSVNITVANGVITNWAANADETISTTNISSIIPQSS